VRPLMIPITPEGTKMSIGAPVCPSDSVTKILRQPKHLISLLF
jgi:hypothetical protein